MKRFYKYRFFLVAFFILFSFSNHKAHAESSADTETSANTEISAVVQTFPYEFSVNTISYSGVYSGEITGGLPDGDGFFQTDDDSPYQFTYNGAFKNGLFHGKGIITLSDSSQLSGKFKNGSPYGKFRLVYEDGNYSIMHFHFGFPYKEMNTYSADSSLISKDFFFDYEAISSLKNAAITVPYKKLFSKTRDYYGNVLKVDGTVLNVYEASSSCIFKISDNAGHLYWGSYGNSIFDDVSQAIMPTLQIGDSIELYAFFKGISTYSCANDSANTNSALPFLSPITGSVNRQDINFANMDANDYENVMLFPFHYYGQKYTLTGTIDNVIYFGVYRYIKLISDTGDDYYLYFNSDKLQNIFPIIGDHIQITGTYNGLYKEYDPIEEDYSALYPLLTVKKYKNK